MQMNDFTIDPPLVDLAPPDEIIVQPSDRFDSRVKSIMIPTIVFFGANQWSANEEFNDSLESQANDFNICDPEPKTMEHDSLESIENTATNASESTAKSPNANEVLAPIRLNENNKLTNTIADSNITKPVETECAHDSEEYDLKDVPGIAIAINENTNKFTQRDCFYHLPSAGSIAEREHMKWKNAVDMPNNPYSPQALQRRLSQSSSNQLLDIDGFIKKINASRPESPQHAEPLTVNLAASKMDPIRFVSPKYEHSKTTILEHFLARNCRYGRDYYINNANLSYGARPSDHIHVDTKKSSGARSNDQDHNNNRSNRKRTNVSSDSGSDNDTDSVSDIEIIFNRKQSRNAVTLARNVRKKWPAADALLKRSMSLCSVRTYAHNVHDGNIRMHTGTHGTPNTTSNCSLDQLAPAKSIGQIEEQALHSDIRRCSFRSRNGTNNFVVNPLFDGNGTEF